MRNGACAGVLALFAGGAVGCGSRSYVKQGQVQQTIEHESIGKKYIETIGIGAANPELKNDTQRRASSRNAAVVQAQYEMLFIVKGIQLEGGVTVKQAVETDSQLRTRVDAAIQGAEVIKTEWTADDGCVVTLRLDKGRLEDLMGGKFK